MICKQCGEQLPDSAKFCSKCGAKVESTGEIQESNFSGPEKPIGKQVPSGKSSNTNGKKNKKWTAVIIGLLVLILIVGGVSVVYTNTPERRYARQVALGDRYLSEMDYERAMVAYETAISIDPSNTIAYAGLYNSVVEYVDSICSSGETATLEQAQKIVDAYNRIEKAISDAEKHDIDPGISNEDKKKIKDEKAKNEKIIGAGESGSDTEDNPNKPDEEAENPDTINIHFEGDVLLSEPVELTGRLIKTNNINPPSGDYELITLDGESKYDRTYSYINDSGSIYLVYRMLSFWGIQFDSPITIVYKGKEISVTEMGILPQDDAELIENEYYTVSGKIYDVYNSTFSFLAAEKNTSFIIWDDAPTTYEYVEENVAGLGRTYKNTVTYDERNKTIKGVQVEEGDDSYYEYMFYHPFGQFMVTQIKEP